MARLKNLPSAILLLIGQGCASTLADLDDTYVEESFVLERWLPFVRDGVATREEIIESLGQPTAIFEEGRILSFRLILVEPDLSPKQYRSYMGLDAPWAESNPEGAFNEKTDSHNARRRSLAEQDTLLVIGRKIDDARLWQLHGRESEYSLVLVFDRRGVLNRYCLLRVKP